MQILVVNAGSHIVKLRVIGDGDELLDARDLGPPTAPSSSRPAKTSRSPRNAGRSWPPSPPRGTRDQDRLAQAASKADGAAPLGDGPAHATERLRRRGIRPGGLSGQNEVGEAENTAVDL